MNINLIFYTYILLVDHEDGGVYLGNGVVIVCISLVNLYGKNYIN